MAFEISKLTRLFLGYVGENESRIIDIDVFAWLDQWPDAIIAMTVQRPQEKNAYIPVTEVKGTVLRWTVRREDVAIAGNGMAQIRALQAHTGRVYMSRVVPTVIAASMTGEVDDGAPPPETGWVNTVLLAAADAQQSEDDAKGHADRAEAAVADLEQIRDDAVGEVVQTAADETSKATSAIAQKGADTLASIPEDYTTLASDVSQLSKKIDNTVVAGIGEFATDDWLPLITDLNNATPNRIVAIAKGDYVANAPGAGVESQGTFIPFAYRNSTDAECQVQFFVTLDKKLYYRNRWATDDAWKPWVLVMTSEDVANAVKNCFRGVGRYVTSDSLPLIEDANDSTPNTILAIPKADYVQNMPGKGSDSQGTLMHFAYADDSTADCQVQILVTPERKVWMRNLWSAGDGWRSWVQLETKVTFYVGGDKETHTGLMGAINDANALPEHIHVDIMVCKSINLYDELGGAEYVASFADAINPSAGPALRTNVDLIGVGMPTIQLDCPDDVATYNFTASVSTLNLKGTNRLSGIVFVARNCRYVIHDEGNGNGDYNRTVENCYFYHLGTFEGGWYSGQAYGAGTGHSGTYLFDCCHFESGKMPFSLHNNYNVVQPIVKFVNCIFKGGAGYPGARFGTFGSGYTQGNVYINGCRSSGVIRTVTEGDYDTFNDTGFQIIPGDTVYRTDLAKLTYYAGGDVWNELLEDSDIDTTLSESGKVADAKVTGDKISQLSEEITNLGGGMNSNAAALLIVILRSAVYDTDQSANIDALKTALEAGELPDNPDTPDTPDMPTGVKIPLTVVKGNVSRSDGVKLVYDTTSSSAGIRATINPIAIRVEEGKTYKISLSDYSEYGISMQTLTYSGGVTDFTVVEGTQRVINGDFTRTYTSGWKREDITYTADGTADVIIVPIAKGASNNEEFTTEDIAALNNMLTVTVE